MTNEVKSKVRLVRCPKCRIVLQEPSEPILYKCGGCGAILQAKKRKSDSSCTEPRGPEADSPVKIEKKKGSFASADTLLSESSESRYEIGECSKQRSEDENRGNLLTARDSIDRFDEHESKSTVNRNSSNELSDSIEDLQKHRKNENRIDADVSKNTSPSQDSNRSDLNDFSGHNVEYIENEKSSEEQRQERSEKEISPGLDRISSVDTLESLPLDNRFRATQSYYTYDGSESSCDGDDQAPKKRSHLGRKFDSSKLYRPDDEFEENLKPKTTLPLRRMHRNTGESRNRNQEKRPEARRNRRELGSEEVVSTFPDVSSNWQTHHHHHHHPRFFPSNMPVYVDREKMELMRMVYDLENQLEKTRLSRGTSNIRLSAEDVQLSRLYDDQFHSGKGLPELSKMPRKPFSGEAVHYRHRGDCYCLHCSPQVRPCSSQLPLGSVCCNKSHHNFCNALHSSPQHYSSSEYSNCCHEPNSSNQRHKDLEMRKLRLGEKYAKMRHILPVAGGAPIVSCHHCLKLLQLPAEFGVAKRRWYRLGCGACKNVLKFEVQNQTHVVPNDVLADDNFSKNESAYSVVNQRAPPPSESSDVNERNLSSAPRGCPHAESLSYSDDLGPSFCRSCSTEVESSSVTPIQQPLKRSNRRASSACSQKKFESAGPSNWAKSSSEIEEEQEQEHHPTAGSPLHRLMGYSSVSQVLK